MQESPSNVAFVLPIKVLQQSLRQSYIFDLIFKQLIGIDYQYIDSNASSDCLDYGKDFFNQGYLYSKSLEQPLFENGIYTAKTFPFYTDNPCFEFPFDMFSTCFFAVSRQEELGTKKVDTHGRYLPENSWLWQHGWQYEPIVNYIAVILKNWIEQKFGIHIVSKKKYKVAPTLDIDNGYAFYGRGINIYKSLTKSILTGNFEEVKLKWKCKNDPRLDPFNTHQQILDILQEADKKAKIFFLMKNGDKNSINEVAFQAQLAQKYSDSEHQIGIHPSYNAKKNDIKEELFLLQKSTNSQVSSSRFHYILLKTHSHLLQLHQLGITDEYSMGYPSESGFRAGICEPFAWFDIASNTSTTLLVHPFYFMDASYIFHQKYNSHQALEEVQQLVTTVKKYKGVLCFICHNESLSNCGIYKNWGDFFKKTLEICD